MKEKSFRLNQNILISEEEKRKLEEKMMQEYDSKIRHQRDLLTVRNMIPYCISILKILFFRQK